MNSKIHALIVGEQGVGKSTLINKVLTALGRPVNGIITRKEDDMAEPGRGCPVFIHRYGESRKYTSENRVAFVHMRGKEAFTDVFENTASAVRLCAGFDGIIVLDELGFLESDSPLFCEAVLDLLHGSTPVIAAVKPRSTAFLDAVRACPDAQIFYINEGNRDELADEVVKFFKAKA